MLIVGFNAFLLAELDELGHPVGCKQVLLQILPAGIFSQLLAMVVGIAVGKLVCISAVADNVEIRAVLRGVASDKDIGHDASATIHDATFLGAVGGSVGKMYAVRREELAMLEAILQILQVRIFVSQGVGLLNAAS